MPQPTEQTVERKSLEQNQNSALDTLQAIKNLATQNAALFADRNERTLLNLLSDDSRGANLHIDLKTGELSLRKVALFDPPSILPRRWDRLQISSIVN
jgi:hypothetical protein